MHNNNYHVSNHTNKSQIMKPATNAISVDNSKPKPQSNTTTKTSFPLKERSSNKTLGKASIISLELKRK